ncbi:MAG: hypothetical protein ACYCWW_19030 [Deltaproteobacteria bacterium]
MRRALLIVLSACPLAFAGGALGQRVVRPADAPPPEQLPPAPTSPDVEPLISAPGAKKRPSPPPGEAPGVMAPPKPAGPPPTFKDDLTPDEVKAEKVSGGPACREGCEALYRKKYESSLFTLHVRPAQPKPGQLVELVLEATELLDPPDPELGDRKPMTGETIVAHVEGQGRYLAHPLSSSAGSYGIHFVPQAKGDRHVEYSRLDGRPGLTVDFVVPVGRPVGKEAELRDWSPPGKDRFAAAAAPEGAPGEDGQ